MYRFKLSGYWFVLVLVIVLAGCKKEETEEVSVGKIENNIYRNEYFGLTLKIPEGWSVQDEEKKKEFSRIGSKMISGGNENVEKTLNASIKKRNVFFFSAFKYPLGSPVANNPNIAGLAESVEGMPGVKRGSDVLFHVQNTLKMGGIKHTVAETGATEKIGGVEFDVMKVILPFGNFSVKQNYYTAIMKNYAVSFVLTYMDEEDEKSLEEILETAEFE